MLQQNWFTVSNMVLFYDWYNEQRFYDINTECIYIVEEKDGMIVIEQYQKGMWRYYKLFEQYQLYLSCEGDEYQC